MQASDQFPAIFLEFMRLDDWDPMGKIPHQNAN
jgi:hypothetical protein